MADNVDGIARMSTLKQTEVVAPLEVSPLHRLRLCWKYVENYDDFEYPKMTAQASWKWLHKQVSGTKSAVNSRDFWLCRVTYLNTSPPLWRHMASLEGT